MPRLDPKAVLAVDPGVHYAGAALALNGRITWCGYVTPLSDLEHVCVRPDLCIIEKPQQYAASKARRKDITDLTLAAGKIEMIVRAADTTYWEPREWKGQVPKVIHHARILRALDGVETGLLPTLKTHRGHVLDACGMVLRYLGRI